MQVLALEKGQGKPKSYQKEVESTGLCNEWLWGRRGRCQSRGTSRSLSAGCSGIGKHGDEESALVWAPRDCRTSCLQPWRRQGFWCRLRAEGSREFGEEGENYLVGSSKNMTGGLLTSSRAMARRFLCPPESRAVLVWEQDIRPSAVRISVTWTRPHPAQVSVRVPASPRHHPDLTEPLP